MLSSHEKIEQDPDYQVRSPTLVARLTLSLIMLVIYFGFILLVAYAPKFLGTPLGTGVTTIGIPIGLFVIFAAFLLTGIYVSKANSKYDPLIRKIVGANRSPEKISWLLVTLLIFFPTLALAAGAIDGGSKQAVNWAAIGMFIGFVSLTLAITYWASKRTVSAAISTPRAVESLPAKTASRSPAITCRRPRSWASRALSTPLGTMA